jgi:hypothetical protein
MSMTSVISTALAVAASGFNAVPMLAQPVGDVAFVATSIEQCASSIVMAGPMHGGRLVAGSSNPLQTDRRGSDGAWVRDNYTLVVINGGIAVMRSAVRLSDGAPVPSTPASRQTLQASLDAAASRAPCMSAPGARPRTR